MQTFLHVNLNTSFLVNTVYEFKLDNHTVTMLLFLIINKLFRMLLSPVLSINSSTDCELLEMVPWMVVDLTSFVHIYNKTTKMIKYIAVWL